MLRWRNLGVQWLDTAFYGPACGPSVLAARQAAPSKAVSSHRTPNQSAF
jgi:hypothetical protein